MVDGGRHRRCHLERGAQQRWRQRRATGGPRQSREVVLDGDPRQVVAVDPLRDEVRVSGGGGPRTPLVARLLREPALLVFRGHSGVQTRHLVSGALDTLGELFGTLDSAAFAVVTPHPQLGMGAALAVVPRYQASSQGHGG